MWGELPFVFTVFIPKSTSHPGNIAATKLKPLPTTSAMPGSMLLGGDFNTVRRTSIRRLVDYFSKMGFIRASRGVGPTVKKMRVSPSAADHIFTRGMTVAAAGRQKEINGSDHYPIWVKLTLDEIEEA